jgi:phenylpropionate dioxygenase-like ring-hydroxylating dioxygenase large terminal subunit
MTKLAVHEDHAAMEPYLAGWRRVYNPLAVTSTLAADGAATPRPIERVVAGESLALACIDGTYLAVGNHCPHRGAKLSQGWINTADRTFVCPYHGFEWKTDGDLGKIPAYSVEGLACPSSKRWRTPSYRVIERYGVLWTCLADEPLVPLPDIPPLSDPSLIGGSFVEATIATGAGRCIEGTLDTYHIAFAHRGSIGNPQEPEAPRAEVRPEGQFLYMEFYLDQDQNPSAKGGDTTQRVKVLYQQWGSPNIVYLLKTSPAGRYGLLFFYRIVSAYETVVYRRIFRDYDLDSTEDEFITLENQIDHEDKHIIEEIRPRIIPADPAFELHTVFDKPTLSYRKYMQALGFSCF